jgi:hypothetical protein
LEAHCFRYFALFSLRVFGSIWKLTVFAIWKLTVFAIWKLTVFAILHRFDTEKTNQRKQPSFQLSKLTNASKTVFSLVSITLSNQARVHPYI